MKLWLIAEYNIKCCSKDLIMVYKKFENFVGECKFIIPIRHEYYLGSGSRIAICTLSSIKLLIEI
jgi:hypothetical protein